MHVKNKCKLILLSANKVIQRRNKTSLIVVIKPIPKVSGYYTGIFTLCSSTPCTYFKESDEFKQYTNINYKYKKNICTRLLLRT